MLALNEIHHGDCLELMKQIPDGSVDMVLCDLPYGVTQNKWDVIIPFEPLWDAYKRVCRPNAAIILTASQPFTSMLVMSNIKMFRYCWVWEKAVGTGFLDCNRKPLKVHEDVCVFYSAQPIYIPQKWKATSYRKGFSKQTDNYGTYNPSRSESKYGSRYPVSVIYSFEKRGEHPTQKPVALFEYLIRTYTNEGMVVLDNCIGSGTTAVAAINSNRQFIGIEQEHKYVDIARRRVAYALAQPKLFY